MSRIQEEWAFESPRKKISTPYSFTEKLSWIKNNLFGPSKKFRNLTKFIPQSTILNNVSPKFKLGFVGDIMKMGKRDLEIGNEIKQFFKDIDYLIGNFEGTITNAKKVFMAQEHNERIISTLKTLFPPEKTILTNANNHSGDFGWLEFNKSYEMLKNNGFITIGRRDEPSVLLADKINIVNVTNWSNQPCQYVAKFDEAENYYNSEAEFNILSSHWGYESQLYPNPKQIKLGKQLLKSWDLIHGHHSHVPQPITAYEINNSKKLIAYSLGDFCIGLKMKKYRCGIIFKAEIGPDLSNNWEVGKLDWRFVFVNHIDKEMTRIELTNECKFFENKMNGF
ncbi:MAG: CapA family protein [Candidatus Helarchaeota archaeon]